VVNLSQNTNVVGQFLKWIDFFNCYVDLVTLTFDLPLCLINSKRIEKNCLQCHLTFLVFMFVLKSKIFF